MNAQSAHADIRLGTTLYSLTNEYHSRQYDLAGLIRRVAALGLGPGLELVGFSHFRNFPNVTPQDIEAFRQVVAESGLHLTCLSINADRWISDKHEMTLEESCQYQRAQIETAAKLGFPLVRFQWAAGVEAIERLAADAERLNIKLAMEIHAPHYVQHPVVMEFREMYERVGSPLLGFIPDFGASVRQVPPGHMKYFAWRGIPAHAIAVALEIWNEPGDAWERRAKFSAIGEREGWERMWIVELSGIFGLFSRMPARDWLEIMPRTFHVHGKFYGFDADGSDPAIPTDELLAAFVEGGFRGYISSEWEGHQASDADGFEAIKKHHQLERRILKQLGAATI